MYMPKQEDAADHTENENILEALGIQTSAWIDVMIKFLI